MNLLQPLTARTEKRCWNFFFPSRTFPSWPYPMIIPFLIWLTGPSNSLPKAKTMQTEDLTVWALASYYTLLIIPFSMMLWLRIPIIGKTLLALARMTLQLLFVGFYLQIVFKLNSAWINSLWLVVMVVVADLSIIRGCGLKLRRFVFPLFIALVGGTA
ncbi:MAG TPA: hypothetical protein ENL37_10165, partial [Desulfobacteraceae bacterium]|nr:hypothetical protein [Desulfobacteraceae bacterium]